MCTFIHKVSFLKLPYRRNYNLQEHRFQTNMDSSEISLQGPKMIGSFLSRALICTFAYAYPAYECFKTVEKSEPETEQLVFWCHYWVLIALITICERVGDALISWLPFYGEVKLALFIYLWYPKKKGTDYIYNSFLRPYLVKQETDIDQNLLDLWVKARNIAVLYWQKAACHGQILKCVSLTQPQPAQKPDVASGKPMSSKLEAENANAPKKVGVGGVVEGAIRVTRERLRRIQGYS